MKLAIVGTRKMTDYLKFCDVVMPVMQGVTCIVSGGAKGVDSLAKQFALQKNIPFLEFVPEYEKYGKNATFVRNSLIVEAADRILALPSPDSKGTYDTIRKAIKAKKLLNVLGV